MAPSLRDRVSLLVTVRVGEIDCHQLPSLESAVDIILPPGERVSAGWAVAVNPEKIVLARHNDEVRKLLQAADLRFMDGIGVVLAAGFRAGRRSPRIAGCDLWMALMERCGAEGRRVFLVGATSEVLDEVVAQAKHRFRVVPVGCHHGFFDAEEEALLIRKISDSRPDLIAVAMGSPRQERFILACRHSCPDAFLMGVGGSFDVLAGKAERAPRWMQGAGLEWFFRLLRQPTRIHRHVRLLQFLLLCLSRRV